MNDHENITRHGVGVVLIRKEDRAILMQHRNESSENLEILYGGFWSYLTGKVETEDLGEASLKSEADRELTEETEYVAENLYHVTDKLFIYPDGKKILGHVFFAIYDGIQEIKCNEGQEMAFFTFEELNRMKIVPGENEICEAALLQAEKMGLISEAKAEMSFPVH